MSLTDLDLLVLSESETETEADMWLRILRDLDRDGSVRVVSLETRGDDAC